MRFVEKGHKLPLPMIGLSGKMVVFRSHKVIVMEAKEVPMD
jgi:hypothetical protein